MSSRRSHVRLATAESATVGVSVEANVHVGVRVAPRGELGAVAPGNGRDRSRQPLRPRCPGRLAQLQATQAGRDDIWDLIKNPVDLAPTRLLCPRLAELAPSKSNRSGGTLSVSPRRSFYATNGGPRFMSKPDPTNRNTHSTGSN